MPLTFGNFVRHHGYAPETLLKRMTWSEWRASARQTPIPKDPNLAQLKTSLISAAQTSGQHELRRFQKVVYHLRQRDITSALAEAGDSALMMHYRIWGKPGPQLQMEDLNDSFERLAGNPSVLADLGEVLDWASEESRVPAITPDLPFACQLELHGTYGSDEIKVAMNVATFETAGVTGSGLIFSPKHNAYICLVTFQKTEREFSPSTMYQDYPISREFLHWESPSNTSLSSPTGQKICFHIAKGISVLFFARTNRSVEATASPFTYLGPARLESHESERPIRTVWKLMYPMPAVMFEDNRRGG